MFLAICGHTSFQRNLLYIKPNLWNICEHNIYIISIKEIVSQSFVLYFLMQQHQWHVENTFWQILQTLFFCCTLLDTMSRKAKKTSDIEQTHRPIVEMPNVETKNLHKKIPLTKTMKHSETPYSSTSQQGLLKGLTSSSSKEL
jgi:hypothetical protein